MNMNKLNYRLSCGYYEYEYTKLYTIMWILSI